MNTVPISFVFSTVALVLSLAAAPVRADDQIFILGGDEYRAHSTPAQTAPTYQVEYMHGLNDYFAYSLDYVNQGHFDQGISHHRDMDGVNFWLHTDLFDSHLKLAAGAGPVFYYDTVGSSLAQGPADVHGLGQSYTLAATYCLSAPWLLQMRANWTNAGSFNTRSVMLGVGYQLDYKSQSKASDFAGLSNSQDFGQSKNEFTVYAGQSVVNQPGNSKSGALALEYRRDLGEYVQWTAGFLDEGKNAQTDRRGAISEIWLAKSFLDHRLSLGVGIGAYLAQDSTRQGRGDFVTPMRSITAAYNLTPNLSLRTTLERVITNYNRDSDVFLGGISYRF